MDKKQLLIAIFVFLVGVVHTWIVILINTGTILKRVRRLQEIEGSQPPYRLKWYRRPVLLLSIYLLIATTILFSGIFSFPLLPD